MRKIGFVDFYLGERHADIYFDRINAVNSKFPPAERYEVAYAWAEQGVSPDDGVTSEQWCRDHGVCLCGTIEELCEKVDCVMILSPRNPEKHLEYAEAVLPFGKTTFIDAPIACDCDGAKKIFAVAEKHGTKLFSASALRFSGDVKTMSDNMIIITGGGKHFEESIVHQIEAAVAIVGKGADHICVHIGKDTEPDKCGYGIKVHYPDSRMVTLLYVPVLGFEIITDMAKTPIDDDFYDNFCFEILKFFTSGRLPFGTDEMIETIRIYEKTDEGKSSPNMWIPLRNIRL